MGNPITESPAGDAGSGDGAVSDSGGSIEGEKSDVAAAAPGLVMEDGAAPLPAKLRGYYKKKLVEYCGPYNRGERTLKRWVSAGRKVMPRPDLPPFDEAHRMAAWFRRIYPREPVPDVLLDFEASAPVEVPDDHRSPLQGEAARGVATGGTAGASGMTMDAAAPGVPAPVKISAINLDLMILGDDEEVAQMKSLVAAHWRRVKEASELGDSDGVRRWTPIHKEAVEQLRKTKKAVAEWNETMGKLILREAVENDLAQIIEALRIMRETMEGRVLAELQKAQQKRLRRIVKLLGPALAAAIVRVRESEGAIFQNVESLNSPGAVRERVKLEVAA